MSALSQVETKVREWLVACSHVEHLTAYYVLWSSRADRAAEGLDLSNGVRVLIEALLAERAEEVESSLFIEMLLESEFVWTGIDFLGCLSELLGVWLHWRDWTKRWLHARKIEANLTWTHGLGSKLLTVESSQHTCVLIVRIHGRLQLALVHVVKVSLLQKWIWRLAIRLETLFDSLPKGVFNLL